MAAITLREVLTLPVLLDSRVVAGHRGLGRIVTGVNVMEVPDIESFVKQNEILLTTAYPLREHPEELAGLVRSLAHLGLAALAVKTGRYLERIPDQVLAVADELDFPVIVLSSGIAFNEVIGAVLAVVLTEYGAEPASAEAIRERLTGVALAGGGLGEIARILTGALNRHVRILDPDGVLLGEGSADHGTPGAFDPNSSHAQEFPISVAGNQYGRIVVSGEQEPTLGHRRLIRQACFAAGMHIAQVLASIELDRKMRVLFLEELVSGKAMDEALIRERPRLFGWDFSSPHTVVLCRTTHMLPDSLVDRAAGSGLARGAVAWVRGHEVVALVPTASMPTDSFPWPVAARWQAELQKLGGGDVVLAVGRVAFPATELAASHAAAREALAIAQSTGQSIVRYDSLILERLLRHAPRELLEELVHQEISPLVEADATTGSELCRTLEMYLGTANATVAAKHLFIHYNTMKYRMARISDLLNTDLNELNDPTTRLTLALALRVRDQV